jgi:hypothetical protein
MMWLRRASRAAMVRAACGGTWVAAGAAGLVDEVLGSELAQVVGGTASLDRSVRTGTGDGRR